MVQIHMHTYTRIVRFIDIKSTNGQMLKTIYPLEIENVQSENQFFHQERNEKRNKMI